MYGEIAELQR